MSLTIVSEWRDGRVTITLSMSHDIAGKLLDIVTDSAINGCTRGKTQEFAEQLMKDLDDHVQRADRMTAPESYRCIDCGFFYGQGNVGKPCPNCGN